MDILIKNGIIVNADKSIRADLRISKRKIVEIGTSLVPVPDKWKIIDAGNKFIFPGGIEHRMALLYTYGVLTNKISLNRFVDLVSTRPDKTFGLFPKKGEISVGYDADLVIWDPGKENIISAKTHHQNCDINIYEGFKTQGATGQLPVPAALVAEYSYSINTGEFSIGD